MPTPSTSSSRSSRTSRELRRAITSRATSRTVDSAQPPPIQPNTVRPCASMIDLAPGLADALPSMRTTVATATLSPAASRDASAFAKSRADAAAILRLSLDGTLPSCDLRPSPETRGAMRTQARFAQLAAGAAVAVTLAAGALWLGPARAQDSARPKALLPRFAGHTYDGGHAGSDAFDKRRGMVLVFSDKDPDADRTAALVASVLKGSEKANLAVLGVTRDTDPVLIRHFVKLHGFEFPVIVDSDGHVS